MTFGPWGCATNRLDAQSQPTSLEKGAMDGKRIVIISPDANARSSLRAILEQEGKAEIVGEAGNGHQGLGKVAKLHPDLVLVDWDLPGLSGCSIAATIKCSYLGVQVVLLSPVADFDHLYASVRCGGATTLRRDADAATVLATVRAVLLEQQRFHPWPIREIEPAFADGFVPGQGASIQRPLTDRQAAVLDCLLMGLNAKEIPETLGVTRYGLRQASLGMMRALGVSRKVSAVAIALERGWTNVGRRPAVVTLARAADLRERDMPAPSPSPDWMPPVFGEAMEFAM
jgi:DNA-binding NarL/FixJ family response regulator